MEHDDTESGSTIRISAAVVVTGAVMLMLSLLGWFANRWATDLGTVLEKQSALIASVRVECEASIETERRQREKGDSDILGVVNVARAELAAMHELVVRQEERGQTVTKTLDEVRSDVKALLRKSR